MEVTISISATSTAKNVPISEEFKSCAEMQLMLQSSVVFLSPQIKFKGEKKLLGKRTSDISEEEGPSLLWN